MHFKPAAWHIFLLSTLALLLPLANAEPRTVLPANFYLGDCISQRIVFDKQRLLELNGADSKRFKADRTKYDLTMDYGSIDFVGTTAHFNLVKADRFETDISMGARISTTRYMLHGKITARMKPAVDPGVVSTLITWSDFQNEIPNSKESTQDEIDWEVVGKHPEHPEYNVFTGKSSNMERGAHGGAVSGTITVNEFHDFTIDWRSDRIEWGVDGNVMKTLIKTQSFAALPGSLKPGEFWYPETPSRVQVSVWDGSMGDQRRWAGGPIPWGNRQKITVPYEWIEIQCYDDKDRPVTRWAADGSGPTAENSTTQSRFSRFASKANSQTAALTKSNFYSICWIMSLAIIIPALSIFHL
ncbi:hypothetical protein BATDEDRAFT_25147 [Batrachochytrium dendrobatidis JAM81]|uniref:GH16 domain-containing protein n=2 Tax=Batrachochytrium dendrobatidis TaxID=109871 RepID=F4P2W8_BATDJ|nr:uncharacterized protein BATDEDRAFT_25147 [Batrachochytrium dendrobatidis JAM81]EGF80509.1 hypothetical protein BATDEDRAFT_25147 [Batrachochytrium dendrobatidis JAM81]KAJ8326292.1 hypothetical protein O5D80_005054 [Batrachochytrium dendrobatidis]KAK5670075.1 hypothetical protein QVD99_003398 [Batrachochytrium dendrobatidis]OAJ40925.1 hypothetical protein BDEG_24607 [Batrachochytrium dendrobatidis JEL423]|eukprot:XP_006679035.1 hypothetical protein BATDEDRAFT_25147 [Batrachochytrium dendrobatidis JAM81]